MIFSAESWHSALKYLKVFLELFSVRLEFSFSVITSTYLGEKNYI